MKTILLGILCLLHSPFIFAQGANCSGASPLALETSCVNTAFSLTNGNSNSGASSCVSNINDDGWYQFTATTTITTITITNATNNIALVAYSGSCGTLVEVGCDDQGGTSASVALNTTAGTTYFVRIIRTSNGGGNTNGDICAVVSGCSPITHLDEQFETNPVTGAITSNIYGGGSSNHNASMIMSGSRFGWFNIINGLGDVDFYDRSISGLCVGATINVQFMTRESYGNTNVTYSLVDDLGTTLDSRTLTLNGSYQQITFNVAATTPGLRFIGHCNSTGGNGIDICMENLTITQCCPILLPMKVSNFKTTCDNNSVAITWSGIDNKEGDYFLIERSHNAMDFKVLQTINVDDATNNHNYTWVDNNPLSGTSYYRIRFTKLNQSHEYTSIKSVNCNIENDIRIFPNPFADYLTIISNHGGDLTLIDMVGKEVVHKTIEAGRNDINFSELASGTYYAKFEFDNGDLKQKKIVKIQPK